MRKTTLLFLTIMAALATLFVSCGIIPGNTEVYTISFDSNGADGGTSPSDIEVRKGYSFTVPSKGTLSRKGYDFIAWNTKKDGSGTDYTASRSVKGTATLTLYAKWSLHKYTLTYNLDGGEFSTSSNPSEYTIETTTFTLVNPTKNGYIFRGWKDKNTGEIQTTVIIDQGSIGDKNFTAVWEADSSGTPVRTYTVKFKTSPGKGSFTKEVNEGENIVPDDTGVSREGYRFVCWAKLYKDESTGSWVSEKFNPGDKYTAESNLEFYVIWEIEKYSITYNLDGGSLDDDTKYEYTIETEAFSLPIPQRAGYSFAGWVEKGTSEARKTITIKSGSTGNREFTAKWTEALSFSLKSDGTYKVSGAGKDLTSVIIPATYNNKNVTSIASSAFMSCSNLTYVEIPATVTEIGDSAFKNCSKLKNIDLPSTVKTIGGAAFYNTGLTSIVIPSSVTYIGGGAFYFCPLTEVTLSSSPEFGQSVFEDCDKITKLNLGTFSFRKGQYTYQLKDVFEDSFENITTINVLKTLTDIKDAYSLVEFSALANITVEDGNTDFYVDGNCLIEKDTKRLVLGCRKSVIPDDVKKIENGSFYGAQGLKTLSIPASVEEIGSHAFSNCSSLESIIVDSSNTVYKAENNCIIEKNTNKLILGCKNSTIGSAVTEIGGYAFYGCTGLDSISMSDSVKIIGESAFYGCSALKNVDLNKTQKVELWAFANTSVTSIKISNNTIDINNAAFYNRLAYDGSTFTFSGTVNEWKKIIETGWDAYFGSYTAQCSDGVYSR